jgi:hypothetical protein
MRILVATLLLFSLNATAGEVTEFKPRPAAVEEGSDTYVGILLSVQKLQSAMWIKRFALNSKSSTNYPSKIFRKQSKKKTLGLKETRAPLAS